ncbi:FIST N-terminal domain-containing protein [Kamptonema cortianum]|nr:FIST N-terminal domain-containing protein [Oscillatoria laete-virens]MDK3157159.1 FIST N-terminal domain-containing protein [Kamptonema cortianum]MDL5051135.1 FIST N-terminal domain-containing protein [Oscillatoria amoena NRMC-F 0135]MDL5055041.1 FIST N-terminal domain-containing protein [Oscillatoria laete-virens NRMC-F 0139]
MNLSASVTLHQPVSLDVLSREIAKCRSEMIPSKRRVAFVFMTEHFFDQADEILESVRVDGHAGTVVGCSGSGVLGTATEIEQSPSFSLLLMNLPENCSFSTFHYNQEFIEANPSMEQWLQITRKNGADPANFLIFSDPFTVDSLAWMKSWNRVFGASPTSGGLASGNLGNRTSRVFENGQALSEGGVGLLIEGGLEMHTIVSQGCIPIGKPHLVTKAEQNVIFELGGRPAYEVLSETVEGLPTEMKDRAQGNLFIGFVMNEYQEKFKRGDFLVRNLLGADQSMGALAVGEWPHVGQTVQFQIRDPLAAHEDLEKRLEEKKNELGERRIVSGLMFVCNGRGKNLFQENGHDARTVAKYFGEIPLAGFFCNGEIGPIGKSNFLHGYTASLALFVEPRQP